MCVNTLCNFSNNLKIKYLVGLEDISFPLTLLPLIFLMYSLTGSITQRGRENNSGSWQWGREMERVNLGWRPIKLGESWMVLNQLLGFSSSLISCCHFAFSWNLLVLPFRGMCLLALYHASVWTLPTPYVLLPLPRSEQGPLPKLCFPVPGLSLCMLMYFMYTRTWLCILMCNQVIFSN